MATKQVIAYFMHESEQAAAFDMLQDAETTDSFLVGTIEESQIDELRQRGLVVQELDLPEIPRIEQLIEAKTGRFLSATPAPEPGFDSLVPNYYIVQLRGPLLESWRDRLLSLGVEVHEATAPNSYLVHLDPQQAATLRDQPFVRSVRIPEAQDARPVVDERARAAPPSGTGQRRMLTLDVRLHREADMDTVLSWLNSNGVDIAGYSRRKIRLYMLEDSASITALGALPEVQSVDEFVPPTLTNDRARVLTGVETANPGAGLTQTGLSQIVAVADTGLDDLHPDFQGRIVGLSALGRPGDSSDPNGHGTHVAGTVLGDGAASGGQYKGLAPEAQLYFQSIMDAWGKLGGLPLDLNDLFEEAYQQGARIHNNSWGADTNSRYTFNSIEVDEFVAEHRDMLIVISAGNEGVGAGTPSSPGHAQQGFVDWLSIGSPASAKNALTIGASRSDRTTGGYAAMTWSQAWPNEFPDPPIADELISGDEESLAAFSSRGPCDDRRIKPDLVAPGTNIASSKSSIAPLRNFWGPVPGHQGKYAYNGGTSMSAPVVSGCAALIRQYFVDSGHQPSAALLKATLINGCRWLTGQDAQADFASLPNFNQGFGAIDMAHTIPNAGQPDLHLEFLDDWATGNNLFTYTGQRYRFIVSANSGLALRICLSWTDLPARALQNNLNLQVQSLTTNQKWVGNTDLPMGFNMPDPDNNVEVVRIVTPAAGDFLIQISASNLLSTSGQDFALVVTGELTSSINPY
ncbi:MAG: S8 family serine peptidase [Candidatus Thiodiazotropha sp. (ex Cardiolucina cf. quadrata)]|nr:S8 family serine peptidase [Candidatus Thiodiazotropha sp. (ex Cardiolucina cf. quadrata)]